MSANPRHIPQYQHWCPHADCGSGAPINEYDAAILQCRCFTSRAFFAAQDAMAVELDSLRVPGEQ
jgi:hypothetical protein